MANYLLCRIRAIIISDDPKAHKLDVIVSMIDSINILQQLPKEAPDI